MAQIPAQASPLRTPSKIFLSVRKVALERNIDFNFLRRDSFSIGEKIVKQRWRFFYCLSEPVYIDLVKEFYANLVFNDGVLRSIIKGVEIILNAARLGRLHQMPCVGSCLDELSRKEDGLRSILRRHDVEGFMKIETKDLSVKMRLFHHMISRIFFSRGRRYNLMTGWDICLMHHIISKSPLNLPSLMINVMREALNRSKTPLPYGMALIVVFR